MERDSDKEKNNDSEKTIIVSPSKCPMYCRPMFIAMSGIIGVGKTTMANALTRKIGWDIYYEIGPSEDVLKTYYENMKDNSFSLQIHLLAKRSIQHNVIVYNNRDAITDRSPYEDSAFALLLHNMGYITESQYRIYQNMARVVYCNMRTPTAIVHLDVEPSIALERIKKRGRSYEKNITIEFLSGLRDAYEILLLQLAKEIPVFRINWNVFKDTDKVAKILNNEIANINLTKMINIE